MTFIELLNFGFRGLWVSEEKTTY